MRNTELKFHSRLFIHTTYNKRGVDRSLGLKMISTDSLFYSIFFNVFKLLSIETNQFRYFLFVLIETALIFLNPPGKIISTDHHNFKSLDLTTILFTRA